MSEEKNKKNFRKAALLKSLILIGALILALIYVIIPRIMDFRRRINIAKDLESVYTEAKIVKVVCDMKPTYKSDLKERGERFEDVFPEDGLYYFKIWDSEGYNLAGGYATKDGTVIYDSYAGQYYKDACTKYFEAVVDFEHNFPELDYYISQNNYGIQEYVRTHKCTTFEEYRNERSQGGVSIARTHGYPEVKVGISGEKKERIKAIKAIKEILQNADFDIYVSFYEMRSNTLGKYDDYSFLYEEMVYEPFENGFWGDILEEEMMKDERQMEGE